jgi:hypothetical protein
MKTKLLATILLFTFYSCDLLQFKKSAKNVNPLPNLVGSWTILSYKGIDASGHVHYPYEKDLKGFATFDSAYNYSIAYYTASRPVLSNRDPFFCSDAEIRIAFLSENSFYGTYRQTTDSLFFEVIASSNPSLSWSKERFRYRTHADTLLLISSPKRINGLTLNEYSLWLRNNP